MKRFFSILLILCLLPGVLSGALTGSSARQSAEAAAASTKSGILTIADPTQDQIRAAYNLYQKPTNRFTVTPSVTAPYATGTVDPNYIQQAMNRINLYRLLAKVPALSNSAEKNNIAQHGAVLLGATNKAVHNPPKPSDMDSAFYRTAQLGTYVSNISSYDFHNYVENNGWTMEMVERHKTQEMIGHAVNYQIRDYEKPVFQNVGHRRYLLSPYMQSCGIGTADAKEGLNYYFCLATAASYDPTNELVQDPNFDFIAWPPSGYCPREVMDKTYPWSISLNEDRYLVPALKDSSGHDTEVGDRTGVVIEITRMSDGRVWTFDQNSPDGSQISNPKSYSAPYFYIDKQPLGYVPIRYEWISDTVQVGAFASNALVFRPDFEDNTPLKGIYQVHVTGIKYANGSPAELNYQVNFFEIAPCEHNWSGWRTVSTPTCTEDGQRFRYCSKCNEREYQTTPALGHNWGSWTTTKQPSCTEDGSRSHTCARCNVTEAEAIPALGHNWGDWNVIQEPGCLTDGSRSHSCARCGVTETEPIPALGHDWDEGTVTLEPACIEDGVMTFTCLRCEAQRTEPIPALGHDWDEGVITLEPSCTEDGVETFSCLRCGTQRTEPIPALGHDWDEGVVLQEPGCETEGSRKLSCSRCDAEEIRVIPALGHDWDEGVVTKEPSCTEDGARDVTCQRCQMASTLSIPALGHDWDEGVITREPTHFEEGERLFTCRRCQETYTEPIEKLSFLFDDVKDSGKYYFKPVYWAYDHNPRITGGTDATHFSPNEKCKREQVVSFLYAAYNKPSINTEAENPFTDVKAGKYYYKAVMWAYQNGITGGVGGGKFGVGQSCTREQVVTFLWTAAGKPGFTAAESPFTDVKPGKYYYKAVMWAAENGITGGVGGGKFGVGQTCTRAQIVTFLYKAMNQ